ncbi:MAG TPA: YitT family protein [Lachnospiraceae bacterium]|nr:YitT family protein [Lachnospiraceae bacterium]
MSTQSDFMTEGKRIFLCVAASVIFAANINTFVHTGGLLPGGFSGLTLLLIQIIDKASGITLPYGIIYVILNAPPAILSFKLLGRKFTIYSCVVIGLVSLFTGLFPHYVITYDTLLIAVFGGIVNGAAVCICLFARATSGGTDFISIFISEKFGIDAWNYIMAFNALVLVVDGFIFGWDKALYSIIFQFASIQIINIFYKRYKKNTLFIVTTRPHAVAESISRVTGHGATDIAATGTFENVDRTLVYSVVGSDELRSAMKSIKEADPDAFINVIRTELLNGRFAMRPND